MIIPNLCRNSSILLVVLVLEIGALVLTLLLNTRPFASSFGYISMYLLWIGLASTFILCRVRVWVGSQSGIRASSVVFAICFVVFLSVELFSQWLFLEHLDTARLLRLSIVATLMILFTLRWFQLLGIIEKRTLAHSEAKIQALQSRIQPHFLFNSLNTISELTATAPEQAEQAIHALSLLFRANLEGIDKSHSLAAEINLIERYLQLEKWRKGEKMSFMLTNLVVKPEQWQVPKLILQPLIENAVVHGCLEDGRVEINLDIRESQNHLSFLISNLYPNKPTSSGNGMAVDNIRERLAVLYDDQWSFKVKQIDDKYQVLMRIPKNTELILG